MEPAGGTVGDRPAGALSCLGGCRLSRARVSRSMAGSRWTGVRAL